MECTLQLKEDGTPQHDEIILIPVGSSLTFLIDPSSKITGKFLIYCNAPQNATAEFNRTEFHELPSLYSTLGQFQATVTLYRPGTFKFKVNVISWATNQIIKTSIGSFIVPPSLTVNKKPLPFNSICLQSALGICLGPVENWMEMLKPTRDANYNFLHFTPLQTAGISGSCYSLYDHCQLSQDIFPHLKQSAFTNPDDWEQAKQDYLKGIIHRLETEYGILSMIDIVLNHVSQNSPNLQYHKDMSYNLENSPQLEAGIELHKAIMDFSKDLGENKIEGVSNIIENEGGLNNLLNIFKNTYFPKAALWEYIVIDVEKIIEEYKVQIKKKMYSGSSIPFTDINHAASILAGSIHDSNKGHRNSVTINIDLLCQLFPLDTKSTEFQIRQCMNIVNMPLYDTYDSITNDIFSSLNGTAKYHWLTLHKGQPITESTPLVDPYFSEIVCDNGEIFYAANNGFIWNGNVREDFTSAGKKYSADTAYFRRSINIWGDCVKLRYGEKPSDSQWLWDYMTEYITKMCQIFHGIRLDNAHGTPMHVSSYLADKGRSVNPNLLVCAELFTGDRGLDRFYVVEIGINMLIREAMQAPSPFELSRFVHMCGGTAVGSVNFENENTRNCGPATLPAILYDCTHDNETPTEKRTSEDTLSNGILCCMACCPCASTRGYDEIIPSHLSVVKERRIYQTNTSLGIVPAKKIFNELHKLLGDYNFNEIHVCHDAVMGGADLITIQRSNGLLRRSVITIVRTSFGGSSNTGTLPTVFIPGVVIGVIAGLRILVHGAGFKPDPSVVNGFTSTLDQTGYQSYAAFEKKEDKTTVLHLDSGIFTPGSVLSVLVEANEDIAVPDHFLNHDECMERIKSSTRDIEALPTKQKQEASRQKLVQYLSNPALDFAAFNILLYRCNEEERDVSQGKRGIYDIENTEICFAGIAGICIPLKKVIHNNDMSHPILNNLRNGNWLIDYTIDRLSQEPLLAEIQEWLKNEFEPVKKLPRGYVPCHFSTIMMMLYNATIQEVIKRLNRSCQTDTLIRQLSLTSVQIAGYAPSGKLTPDDLPRAVSLPAGFPHFSTGYMRNWGRDTFIAFRGLLLTTGRFNEAKHIIISYASSLRHGLIPNLLDGGLHARYNSRDATWFFLYSIHEYCSISNDFDILNQMVKRLYPTDDQNDYDEGNHYKGKAVETKLLDIIQEIFSKLGKGISFREWNAGPKIDSKMKDEGFNLKIYLDTNTGFIYGGNSQNCGTWMDKMGEGMKAGTWGVPSTPRDGADIEIIGLLKNILSWLIELHTKNLYPYDGVDTDTTHFTFREWNQKIQINFDKYFYIPVNPREDSNFIILPHLVRGRGYYKDVVGSAAGYSDYQLRPNCAVAMVVAPELFESEHAHNCLINMERYLLNEDKQLGIKTLSFLDGEYRGYYNNDGDCGDRSTDKGFNYHQGPEWLWPYGFYLRARILFPPESWDNSTSWNEKTQYYIGQLYKHRLYLNDDHWASLPELTNKNGQFCPYSCKSQAWSTATLLDALYDLTQQNS